MATPKTKIRLGSNQIQPRLSALLRLARDHGFRSVETHGKLFEFSIPIHPRPLPIRFFTLVLLGKFYVTYKKGIFYINFKGAAENPLKILYELLICDVEFADEEFFEGRPKHIVFDLINRYLEEVKEYGFKDI